MTKLQRRLVITLDISMGNLGTCDLDGDLRFTVVIARVQPSASGASDTYFNPCPRMRWPRPTLSMYYAQSGIRDVIDLQGKVPEKLCRAAGVLGVGSGVYTACNIEFSLALCMVDFSS